MPTYKMSKQSRSFGRKMSYFHRGLYKTKPGLERYEKLILKGHILRPHYAYALLSAAKEAVFLGYEKISVIEFGCASGSGLVDLEYISNQISDILDIQFEIYGFDAGEGMPPSTDYRDLLYMWSTGEYKMEQEELRKRIQHASLVIGDAKDTVPSFFEKFKPAPLGAIFVDMDYYTSTKSCLKIFDYDSNHYMPRVFVYLDDTLETSEFTGELLAVNDYNRLHDMRKISIQSLKAEKMSLMWKNWIYLGKKFYHWHCFDHEKYSIPLHRGAHQLPL